MTHRVLVVTAEPDERTSTETLRAMAQALDDRPDTEVTVWFLRHGEVAPWWPGATIVDDLRTWLPSVLAARLGSERLAGVVRGARLRRWWGAVDPSIVVLDDGLGTRVLPRGQRAAVIARRVNDELPRGATLEPAPLDTADIVLAASGAPSPAEAFLLTPALIEVAPIAVEAPIASHRVREHLGIADDLPLVIGWGIDGWLDGSDLFVRALWHLEHRHGIRAAGAWIGMWDDPGEWRQLQAEAVRCGLEDRFFRLTDGERSDRWAGDVVLLPYRSPATQATLLEVIAAGIVTVTFEPAVLDDPAVQVVAPLDLEAVADALAAALGGDRDRAATAARQRIDATRWAENLLDLIGSIRS